MTNQTQDTEPFSDKEREEFFRHYVVCALWSSTDEEDTPLDQMADVDDLEPNTAAQMRQDCNEFITANAQLLRASGLSVEQMGHDLWLTRNGHGAGYWDRGIGAIGEKLTRAAKELGAVNLFLNDAGFVDCMHG